MTDPSHAQPTLTTPPDGAAEPPTGAQAQDDASEEHGRVGYGRYGRWTPFGLALLLVAALLAIGILNQRDKGTDTSSVALVDGTPAASVAPGSVAPDFTMTLFSGQPLRLSDLRGKVVVLNFWASWCDPCKREMPAYQTVAAGAGPDLAIVGIGLKNDKEADARAFAKKYGVTYAIGRDSGGARDAIVGPIEQVYGIFGAPVTIVIHPDGTVATIASGPQTEDDLRAMIAKAK